MELDDLKTNWTNNDNLLKSSITVNLDELTKRNLNKSKRELSKPLMHEIANVIVIAITAFLVLICSIIYINELKFSIPGFIAVIIAAFYFYLSIVKTIKISKVDFINLTIIEIQKEISAISLLILKFRKRELILFPIFIISALPIIFKSIQQRDLYADIPFFIFEIIFIIGFGLIGMFWINKNLYDKKIKRVQLFLKEIIAFEA